MQALAAAGGLGRQEAFKGEAITRQAGHAERGDRRTGTGNRADLDPGFARGADQAVARVADQRSTGITDQCQRLAGQQARHDPLRQRFFIVVMQRHQGLLDAEVGQQLAAAAGVLGADRGHRTQHVLRARGQIGEVADRGGNDIQRGDSTHQRLFRGQG
ncbi:hypothetical protein D3C71_1601850 [compost metagenome]